VSRGRRALGGEASERARRNAVGILQVLSGIRTPGEASAAMGVTVNRYYQLESRAVVAMLRSLEPLPRGRRRTADHELERMRVAKERAEREAARNLALVRASQRALGFREAPKKEEGGKRRRRPRVRARTLIAEIEAAAAPAAEALAEVQETAAPGEGGPS
jgi:hypothetical protein